MTDDVRQVGDDVSLRRQCCPKCGAAGWRAMFREPSGVFWGLECIGCSTLITAALLDDPPALRKLWEHMAEERSTRRRWKPERLKSDEFEA